MTLELDPEGIKQLQAAMTSPPAPRLTAVSGDGQETATTATTEADSARFTAVAAELAEHIAANLSRGPEVPYGITVHHGQDGPPPTDAAEIRQFLASGHVWLSWLDEKVTAGLREMGRLLTGDSD